MGSTSAKIKERIKSEGQMDQVVGEVKEAAENVKDKVERVVEKVRDA